MRNVLLSIGLISLVLFASCGKKELEQKLVNQKAVKDSVQAALNAKNGEVEGLFQQLNEIEDNLNTVTSKYSDVEKVKNRSGEINQDARSRISSQIQDINEILNQNKQKVAALSTKLKKTQNNNKQLTAFIDKLQSRISEQEEEIQLLTTELQKKNIVISNLNKNLDELSKQNQQKDEHIMRVEEEKNTAYYIVGTKKELKAKGIISSTGGFLGMGKRSYVSSDSDLGKYNKIDARKLKTIALPGRKIKILTAHSSSSYKLNGSKDKPTSLQIEDANSFWAKSKFLVIVVD
ncbi:MAG: hypothetical protein LKE30_07365 [Bacteroidales bacterium]|jgi:uncharacterized phage infection (PIP) family protein YhgE|nr:hypothetical protein [Bacteroidales bacterium]